METQQYKHRYYYFPNGTTLLVYEVLIPSCISYYSNDFYCFSPIMLGYFNFFFTVLSNWNVPNSLCYARCMSL